MSHPQIRPQAHSVHLKPYFPESNHYVSLSNNRTPEPQKQKMLLFKNVSKEDRDKTNSELRQFSKDYSSICNKIAEEGANHEDSIVSATPESDEDNYTKSRMDITHNNP